MITNQNYIESHITTDNGEKIPFLWTHGATNNHMGDGIIVYSMIQHMRYKNCVCIGTGGGYIPRIMTQARIDLHKQGIFEGNPTYSWGDIGTTYVVDPCNGVGGESNVCDMEDSKKDFFPFNGPSKFINELKNNNDWVVMDLFNFGNIKDKPSSTGLTLIKRK